MKIPKEWMIVGRNAVAEAILSNTTIQKIYIQQNAGAVLFKEAHVWSKNNAIPIKVVPQSFLDQCTQVNHQGIIAIRSQINYTSIEEIIKNTQAQNKAPLLLMLDQITDVRNFGGIARTALCMNVDAIIIGAEHASPVNDEAIKASSGALMHIPIARELSLHKAITILQENDIQLFATDLKAELNFTKCDYTLPTCIVMGSEDQGVRPHIKRQCQHLIKIPISNNFDSMNVGIATGIILYEAYSQRYAKEI